MKIKPIKQKDSIGCGPACVKMATDYFKFPISSKKIAEVSDYKKKEGLFNKDLVATLQRLGFNTEEKINSTWDDIDSLNTKENVIIISWMMKGYIGHFSVVEKINKTHIFIANPESGKIEKIQKIIFMRLWFGYDLENDWYPKNNSEIDLHWMVVVHK